MGLTFEPRDGQPRLVVRATTNIVSESEGPVPPRTRQKA